MEMSENEIVSKIANIADVCPRSTILVNQRMLHDIVHPVWNEENGRIAQIKELNCCLDGEINCGLTTTEIKDILAFVSTQEIICEWLTNFFHMCLM